MEFLFSLLFSIIISPHHTENPCPLPASETDKMKEVASMVLNDLKRAKGILPGEAPQLTKVFRFRAKGKLATIFLDKGEIHLDSKTYLTCRGMGKDSLNALAFLLGHELGHFIHEHGGINHNIDDAAPSRITQFAAVNRVLNEENLSTNFENRLDSVLQEYQETHDEAEADFEGAFLGYLAGYQTLNAGRTFLERVYINIEIDSTIKGYPTLEERLEILENTIQELEELTPLFELSKYLTAIGQYADAIPLLERVLEKFQSPEIYNNIGVLQLLHIQSLYKKPLTKYRLPLTLDAEFKAPHPQNNSSPFGAMIFPLPNNLVNTNPCRQNSVQESIDISESYFRKAVELDKDYALAHMNLSTAHLMTAILYEFQYVTREIEAAVFPNCQPQQQEEFTKAIASVHQAKQICNNQLTGNCLAYYDHIPADSIVLKTFAPWKHIGTIDTLKMLPLPKEFLTIVDSTMWERGGASRQRSINMAHASSSTYLGYPKVLECFNELSYSQFNIDPHFTFTQWLTDDNSIPDEGVVLSNSLVLLDLINILNPNTENDSLDHSYPEPLHIIRKAPFERALEIHPLNDLAKYNKDIYNGLQINSSSVHEGNHCKTTEQVNGIDITEIIEQTTWDFKETIKGSRLLSYYKNDAQLLTSEVDKLFRKQFDLFQHIAYTTTQDYKLFMNNTTVKNGTGERSVFLIPNIQRNTSCDLAPMATIATSTQVYGPAMNKVLTTTGVLHSHLLTSSSHQEEPIVEIDEFGMEVTKIPFTRYTEDGIILEFNNSNQLDQWGIYQKLLKTKLQEEQ